VPKADEGLNHAGGHFGFAQCGLRGRRSTDQW